MREILFRGKGKRDGKWVEGGIIQGVPHELWQNEGRVFVMVFPRFLSSPNLYEVDPSTVGQYIGLKDRNGRRIFEGDIVRHYNRSSDPNCYAVGLVFWSQSQSRFQRTSGQDFAWLGEHCDYEVIGNFYDNPELLGVKCDG